MCTLDTTGHYLTNENLAGQERINQPIRNVSPSLH